MGDQYDSASDQDEMPDFTQPVSLTTENTAPSSGLGATANGPYQSTNPLLPGANRGMAALDGNQPFTLSGTYSGDDKRANDSMLDDLTIPKDPHSNGNDNAQKPDASADKSAGNNNVIVQSSDDRASSNAAASNPPVQGSLANAGAAQAPGNGGPAGEGGNTEDPWEKAERLSTNPIFSGAGTRLSEDMFHDRSNYQMAIFKALMDEKNAAANEQKDSGSASGTHPMGPLPNDADIAPEAPPDDPNGRTYLGNIGDEENLNLGKTEDGTDGFFDAKPYNDNGHVVLIPLFGLDGSGPMTDEQAIDQYNKTQKNFGTFVSPEAAEIYAARLGNKYEMKQNPKEFAFFRAFSPVIEVGNQAAKTIAAIAGWLGAKNVEKNLRQAVYDYEKPGGTGEMLPGFGRGLGVAGEKALLGPEGALAQNSVQSYDKAMQQTGSPKQALWSMIKSDAMQVPDYLAGRFFKPLNPYVEDASPAVKTIANVGQSTAGKIIASGVVNSLGGKDGDAATPDAKDMGETVGSGVIDGLLDQGGNPAGGTKTK